MTADSVPEMLFLLKGAFDPEKVQPVANFSFDAFLPGADVADIGPAPKKRAKAAAAEEQPAPKEAEPHSSGWGMQSFSSDLLSMLHCFSDVHNPYRGSGSQAGKEVDAISFF
jgi:hypothetical protein